MHSLVANHGEFLRAGCDKNQNPIALFRFLHSELMKIFFERRRARRLIKDHV